jgi:coenzyme PQQ biosynthesis protein PqqD
MNVQDLRTMLDYHYWGRDRVLDALEPLTPEQLNHDTGSSFGSIRETLVHLYAAEWAWYSRWHGKSPTALLPSDQFPDRLYPEGVVLLNDTGAAILDLGDGRRSVADIAAVLQERYGCDVVADVIEYLSRLVERELVRVE